jgi:hypothetical protein
MRRPDWRLMASVMPLMDASDWTITDRPYDLRERLFNFAIVQTGILTPAHDPVINECAELVKIVAALIRKSTPT